MIVAGNMGTTDREKRKRVRTKKREKRVNYNLRIERELHENQQIE